MSAERKDPDPRPQCISHELLATSHDELPAELEAAIAQTCAETAWVRAAYVCRVRREYSGDGGVKEALSTFVLPDPPLEQRLTTGGQRVRFLTSLPEAMQDGGVSVLADLAVANVEELGIRVYERG